MWNNFSGLSAFNQHAVEVLIGGAQKLILVNNQKLFATCLALWVRIILLSGPTQILISESTQRKSSFHWVLIYVFTGKHAFILASRRWMQDEHLLKGLGLVLRSEWANEEVSTKSRNHTSSKHSRYVERVALEEEKAFSLVFSILCNPIPTTTTNIYVPDFPSWSDKYFITYIQIVYFWFDRMFLANHLMRSLRLLVQHLSFEHVMICLFISNSVFVLVSSGVSNRHSSGMLFHWLASAYNRSRHKCFRKAQKAVGRWYLFANDIYVVAHESKSLSPEPMRP